MEETDPAKLPPYVKLWKSRERDGLCEPCCLPGASWNVKDCSGCYDWVQGPLYYSHDDYATMKEEDDLVRLEQLWGRKPSKNIRIARVNYKYKSGAGIYFVLKV